MKKISILTLMLLFTLMTNAQNQFEISKDHDAILVADVDVSAKFYSEILGLEEIPNGGLPDHIRWFALGNEVQVHLIESDEKPEKLKGVHMALNTPKLQDLMQHLSENKIPFENWTGEKGTTNTRPDGVKQIYFQDPDGYWIEVNDNQF